MAKQWCTKEDVLQDLEVASSRRVADVEDKDFLYGEQRPPHHVPDDEAEELELRFGPAASQGLSQGEPEPDLIGITKMLRMVQEYENSSEDELPHTPNKRIVISKVNSNRSPNAENTRGHLKDSHNSPYKKKLTSDVTFINKSSPKKMAVTGGLSTNIGASGDQMIPNDGFITSDPNEANHVRINTSNGTVISKLNPNVKEFVPNSTQMESTQNSGTTEVNLDVNHITTAQSVVSNDSNNKLDNKIDRIKTIKDAATDEIGDSKEKKKKMAMILKNQISTKNDTFRVQQQTNIAIIYFLKLYAEPRPPLKLLTPDFFSKSIDKNTSIEESNTIDHSLERMTYLHSVEKVDVDETSSSSRDLTSGSQDSMSVTFGRSEASDMTADASLYKENIEKEYDDIAFARNDILEKDNMTFNKAYYDKNNDAKAFKENERGTCQYNMNMDEVETKEDETTQLTPDIGEISIHGLNAAEEHKKIDPYMEESISKINNWLHDKPVVTIPEKSKGPSLYLGAVAYKRKDPLTCKSPNEITGKKVPKPTEYKPSSYAKELHKKYSERSKTATPTPILNIWEKLEADLKKKDMKVKNHKKSK